MINSPTNNGLVFTSAERFEAEAFMKRWHYSGSLNASMRYAFSLRRPGGLFGDRGEIVACCCFAQPVNRHAKEGELELVRLARVGAKDDELPVPLSVLVSKSLRWLTQNASDEWKLVISYADLAHEHHGGIYQATNFYYVAKSETGVQGFRNKITGEVIHKRTAYERWGTSSERHVKYSVDGGNWEPVKGTVKYLYAYPLVRGRKAQLARLAEYGYEPLPYPKPDWPGGIRPTP